ALVDGIGDKPSQNRTPPSRRAAVSDPWMIIAARWLAGDEPSQKTDLPSLHACRATDCSWVAPSTGAPLRLLSPLWPGSPRKTGPPSLHVGSPSMTGVRPLGRADRPPLWWSESTLPKPDLS